MALAKLLLLFSSVSDQLSSGTAMIFRPGFFCCRYKSNQIKPTIHIFSGKNAISHSRKNLEWPTIGFFRITFTLFENYQKCRTCLVTFVDIQNGNVAHFARTVEGDFLCDFQTP